MVINYLDFNEESAKDKLPYWHIDLSLRPECYGWINICYGPRDIVWWFADMVDILIKEFGIILTTEQVMRLAECTPGLIVLHPSDSDEDYYKEEARLRPISSRFRVEEFLGWRKRKDDEAR